MSTRKPKPSPLYTNESPSLWLQTVTATVDRNSAALCQKQWQSSNGVATSQLPSVARPKLH